MLLNLTVSVRLHREQERLIFVGMISMTRVTLKCLLIFGIIRMGDNYDCNGKIYTEVFYFDDINGVGMSTFRDTIWGSMCFWGVVISCL